MYSLAGTVLLLPLLSALPTQARAELVNRIVATIDGDPVTLYEVKEYRERNSQLRGPGVVGDEVFLDSLITERIIGKEVVAQGIVIRDEDVDRYIDGIRERNRLSEDQLHAALEQQGISWEAYRRQVKEDLEKVQLLNREIRGKVNITPEDVERYYEAHRDEYSTPAQVSVSHIVLLKSKNPGPGELSSLTSRAEDLYRQLQKGADFAELARQYSQDPAAESGGQLGTFAEGEMLEEFERVVDTLQPGEFSEPFWTSAGIHIVRLDERIGSGYQPLESLAEGIKENLYNKAMEERYERWFREDLRQRHHVEMLP